MAFSVSSKIGLSGSTFYGSSRELCVNSSTRRNSESRRGGFVSQWRPSAAGGGSSSKQGRESDFPTLSLSPAPSSLHAEDWWRRPSNAQTSHSNMVFPCNAFDTHMGLSSMVMGDGWNFDGSPFSSSSPPPPPPSSWSSISLKEYPCPEICTCRGPSRGVPVFVMLPLDSVSFNNTVTRKRAMNASLLALKSAGVKGVMMDVWWGIVEKDGPGNYNWAGYKELIDMVKKYGLKVQAVMSFHQCGGNVGDPCFIPLPRWVVEEIDVNQDLVYTDRHGRRNYEYLSLGCDSLPVLKGRSPVQVYSDYMRSFRDNFRDLLGDTIVEIQIGMGPAGVLRYPSHPESNGTWRFPGIGEFQSYDKYMLASLKAAADQIGNLQWGHTGPSDAAQYNNWPEESDFFCREGGWNSPYGNFFLEWYSRMLIAHGERILASAEGVFRGCRVKISGKVAGVHWHYGTRSHAAELTAGYYNTRFRDGYLPIAQMFGRHGVVLNFTCIEMRDTEQPSEAMCSPENLIRQVVLAARQAGVPVAGENALPRFDAAALRQVVRNSRLTLQDDPHGVLYEPMCAFTFLRMSQTLFQSDNWRNFVPFVRQMAEGRTSPNEWNAHHRASKSFVHAMRPLIQEAATALAHH